MPSLLVLLLSLSGLVFFAVRLVTDPAAWPTSAVGVAACLLFAARNATLFRSNRTIETTPSLSEICDVATLDDALGSERAILYKHSTRCPVSSVVINEVLRFGETHPDWKVYVLKVIERRGLSNTVADRLGVPHASPQAFVIKQGRCVWHTSHSGITEQRLSRHAA
ncbi:MAG: bacillithiol system redox-active protein YtxJ [Acidobacteria bacterium]|jgi:bacillithiol system protein YtxJ|nr:bacillithiol system redox-active protein YtxJ [Acidobacteriota bacterium]MDP7340243.1 bacillithiol system redox-active protein YtxJ [Vicinamibacterales bacterium]MDP7478922.1 bacillithiol system redox-active protein YtxJ [Vicinamibacterales bacterium]|tara:strand:- start:922 stop:1419 length:498 start_codon:yes stop_codon:yes gene_type:complete